MMTTFQTFRKFYVVKIEENAECGEKIFKDPLYKIKNFLKENTMTSKAKNHYYCEFLE